MAKLQIERAWVEFPVSLARIRDPELSRAGGPIDVERGVVIALRDISLELNDGDRLGLIGHNGAGKSTLLRLLAGAYAPTRGRVLSLGRISTLFNTTPGLNLDGTGRENIVACALHLGMRRRQIAAKIDEIAAFAELGPYIDLPVRIYSAGMVTRLGFSIATAVEPEVLLLDEGLSTGDAQFAEKAQAKMQEMMRRAAILVVASHSDSLVSNLCTRCVVLDRGSIVADGPSATVLKGYRAAVVAAAQSGDAESLHLAYRMATEMVRNGVNPPLELEEQSLRYALGLLPDDAAMLERLVTVLSRQGKEVPAEIEVRIALAAYARNPAREELGARLAEVLDRCRLADLPPDLQERVAATVRHLPSGRPVAPSARRSG